MSKTKSIRDLDDTIFKKFKAKCVMLDKKVGEYMNELMDMVNKGKIK